MSGLAAFSLAGKVADVVGARPGMGRAFALGFAEAGADVVVTDLKIEDGHLNRLGEEIKAMGRRSLVVKCDMSSKDEVDGLMKQAVEEFGTIDILANVAVMYHEASLLDLDEEGWDLLTDVNLKGYWLVCKAVAPIMQKQKKGSIINMGSLVGQIGQEGATTYCATKGAISAFT